MDKRRQKRFRSARAYRRQLDQLTAQAARGEIPWSDVSQAAAAIKTATEMLMAENLMKLSGVEDREVDDHEMGQDGGLDDYNAGGKAKIFVKQRVEVTRGKNARGDVVDLVKTITDAPIEEDDG